MAGMTPKWWVTSVEYSNDSISEYGINTFVPEYSNVSDSSEVVSSRPTAPAGNAGTVPPAYITRPSSAARAVTTRAESKQKTINLLMLYLLWFPLSCGGGTASAFQRSPITAPYVSTSYPAERVI